MRAAALGVACLLLAGAAGCGREPPAARSAGAPDSATISFSHAEHAGELGLRCLFCHGNAARAAKANLPSARDCFVCHWTVGEGKPEVAKIGAAIETGRPLHWPAVVRLPEHVQFDHAAHVRRGLDCAVCHGDVSRMEELAAPRRLDMRFCVDCHRREDATRDCMACHR